MGTIADEGDSTVDDSLRLSVAAPGHFVQNDARFDLFEERSTPEAGIGLFALRTIPAGIQIFNEIALIHLPVQANPAALHHALVRLDDTQREAFVALSYHRFPEGDTDWISEVRDAYAGNDEDFESYCGNILNSWRIFQTNRFTTIRNVDGEPQAMALFVQAARLNHSCEPNVFHRYIKSTGRLSIHTSKEILRDEQLFTSYIDICKPRNDRRSLLHYWGFECSCSLCSITHIDVRDARRRRINTLMARMKRKKSRGAMTSKDHISALANAITVLNLMRDEGLNEPDSIGVVYEYAERHCLALGRNSQAEELANKRQEILERCLGVDHE